MAPISPAGSLKRSRSPIEDSPAEEEEGHQSKKIRTESVADEEAQEETQEEVQEVLEEAQEQAQTPTPKVAVKYGGVNPELFDEIPHQLLKRSVAVILEHVGFSAASPEALEALCSEVETCGSFPLRCTIKFTNCLRCVCLPFASYHFYDGRTTRPSHSTRFRPRTQAV